MPSASSPPADTERVVPLDAALDFMRLLWSIEHGLQKISKRMEADIGVTGPQRLVLRVVGRFPGVSAGELARIVRLHPSTITGVVQRLVARGLLVRERDPGDSRRVQLRLNAKAAAYTRVTAGTVEHAVKRALTKSGRRRVTAARELLAEIARNLNDSW